MEIKEDEISQVSKYEILKYYPGSVGKAGGSVRVRIRKDKIIVEQKCFSPATYNNSKAKVDKAVELYIQRMCDKHKLTVIQKVKIISEEMKQYFAAVVDGDGSVQFKKDGVLTITVTQSSCDKNPPNMLMRFKECFDGSIQGPRHIQGKYKMNKPVYTFYLGGRQCQPLLEIVAKYGIIKKPQAQMALECIKQSKNRLSSHLLTLSKNDKKFFYNYFDVAKSNESYAAVEIEKERITDAWIAGFFDAEGYVGHQISDKKNNHCIRMSFAQGSCVPILHAINEKFENIGYVTKHELEFRGQNILKVISRIEKYLIEKKEQVALVKNHLQVIASRNRKERNEDELKFDYFMAKKCSMMKKRKMTDLEVQDEIDNETDSDDSDTEE